MVGELRNDDSVDHPVVMLSATFYDASGTILGTANGAVNQIEAGQTKTFRLSSVQRITGVADLRVQVDGHL